MTPAALSPPSILFVHSADEGFGSDRVLLSMVDGALERGMPCRVVLPDDTEDGWLSGQLEARGVGVRKGPLAPARQRYLSPRRLPAYAVCLLRAARFLRGEVRRERTTIVHVNTSTVPAAAALFAAGQGRLIWHVHEVMTSPRSLAWLFRLLPVWAADDVVAVSDAVATNLATSRLRRAVIHRIYNPLAPHAAAVERTLGDSQTCVFAGRISERKGYDVFVDAAGEVASNFPGVRFVIAGVPPPGQEWRMDALRRRLEERGIAERTEVLGMCDDLDSLFDRSDVAVFPTRLPEGFGLAMVEAMRSGCTVIAADHGAASEILDHGRTGLLVAPGDCHATAAALTQALSDPDLRERIGAAGKRHVTTAFSDAAFRTATQALWERSH